MTNVRLSYILNHNDDFKVCPYCEGINHKFTDKCTTCNTLFTDELPYYKQAKDRAEELLVELGKNIEISI